MTGHRWAKALGALGLAALTLVACGDDDDEQESQAATQSPSTTAAPGARANVVDGQGRNVGQVTFTEVGGRVTVDASLRDLPPGFHGFHVHAVGKCEPPFTSAGGHLAVGEQGHPAHAGDQPVLLVLGDGTAELRFTTDRFGLSDLVTGEGRAVIVHAAADNYGNVPTRYASAVDDNTTRTGDAGDRIACGAITRG